jgi:type IV pilus assembly protein PilF
MPTRTLIIAWMTVALAACAATVSEADHANSLIHHDIAIDSMNHGDLRAALRELLLAVDLDPSVPQVHHALGLVYHAMGRLQDGLEHYKKAIELKPDFSEAHNNMGALLIDLGRYDEAIAAFKVALADILYATPSLAEGNMGWAYYKKGDVEAALKHLRNAVAQNPKFCRGYEWLARIGLDEERPSDVVANCKRFEKYCAGDPDIARSIAPEYLRQMKYYLGMGLVRQGERNAARAALSTCADGDADSDFATQCLQALRALE